LSLWWVDLGQQPDAHPDTLTLLNIAADEKKTGVFFSQDEDREIT